MAKEEVAAAKVRVAASLGAWMAEEVLAAALVQEAAMRAVRVERAAVRVDCKILERVVAEETVQGAKEVVGMTVEVRMEAVLEVVVLVVGAMRGMGTRVKAEEAMAQRALEPVAVVRGLARVAAEAAAAA